MIIQESEIKLTLRFKTRNEYLRRKGVMEPVKYGNLEDVIKEAGIE